MRPLPGDLLLTRNQKGWPARLIRLGAALRDDPNSVNHVIIAHHVDEAGTYWGIEGRPGGVGWVDLRRALRSRWTVANEEQPKSADQRTQICEAAVGLLGTPYDWTGIALDGMAAIGADKLWQSGKWGPQAPAHVVCSSLADWVYEKVGLASPAPDRTCTPADWARFIVERGWQA